MDDDQDGFTDDVHGYNFVSNNGNPMDDNGHGTHVSGTIAAVGNNSLGVAGVNWSASIMALKFMDSTGSGYLSDAIRAINYATMERTQYGVNVRVDKRQLGRRRILSAMQTAIQAADNAGIMFVAAAGNSGTNNDVAAQYPANYTRPTSFPWPPPTRTINWPVSVVTAPQPSIWLRPACRSIAPCRTTATAIIPAPAWPRRMVSGVAALAWAYDPNATVADIRNAILQGVDHVGSLERESCQRRRLDAYNTLKLLGAGSRLRCRSWLHCL